MFDRRIAAEAGVWHRRAISYIAQTEMADCDAASLAMALGYDRHVSLTETRSAAMALGY